MAFTNRWDYILDKAVKVTGQHRERLCLGWPHIISDAHRNRHALGPEETQWVAEVMWWGKLFPKEPFPEDWKADGEDENTVLDASAQNSTGAKVGNKSYKSCWVLLKDKALQNGFTEQQLIEAYTQRLLFAIDGYLANHGIDVVQFRAELLTWRDLFPDEAFVGIDPQTGAQNLRTSNDVRSEWKAGESKKVDWVAGTEALLDPLEVQVPPKQNLDEKQDDHVKHKAELGYPPTSKVDRSGEPSYNHGLYEQEGHYNTQQEATDPYQISRPSHRSRAEETGEEHGRQESRHQRDAASAKGYDLFDQGYRGTGTRQPGRDEYDNPARESRRFRYDRRESRELFDERTPWASSRYGHGVSSRGRGRSNRGLIDDMYYRPNYEGEDSGRYFGAHDSRYRSRSPREKVHTSHRRERSPLEERERVLERGYEHHKRSYRESEYGRDGYPKSYNNDREERRRSTELRSSRPVLELGRRGSRDCGEGKPKPVPRSKAENESVALLPEEKDIAVARKDGYRRDKSSGIRHSGLRDLGAELRSYGQDPVKKSRKRGEKRDSRD